MWQYDWSAWNDRVKSFTGKWALERWFLMYLHEQKNIDALALEVQTRLAAEGRSAQVQVQSIWVDGTPQAEFSPKGRSPLSKNPQCELADLLLCVRWESPDGLLQREQATLIQAKVASKYNKLPGGKSTRKERLLFEDCDRHKEITLYPGVNRENPIGAYQLGSGVGSKDYGLRDCASFLLMAKAPWSTTTKSIGPLQVGWPLDKKKTEIKPPETYLDAVINMVSGAAPGLGREVRTGPSAKHCVWTKMVNNLRGKYETITMSGYNGQARVTTSAGTVSAAHFVYSLINTGQSYREFSLNLEKISGLSQFFLHSFDREEWKFAGRLKRRMDPHNSKSAKFVLAFMEYFGLEDPCEFNLWRDDPTDPPPQDSNFNGGNGPHISTLMVTIRGDEQFHRPD
jgi:hypothetical protein